MQSSICILTFYEEYRTVSISLHRNTTDTERTTDTSLPNKRKFKVIHYIRNTIYKSTSKIKIDGVRSVTDKMSDSLKIIKTFYPSKG